jgi:peptide/nickel transport system substrate-binding protein
MITRRTLGGLAAASLVVPGGIFPAGAGENSTFVSGWGLPSNLDPHRVFDVPMKTVTLNAYDGLYRYENDPPEIVPWLAESHTIPDTYRPLEQPELEIFE